MAEIIKLSRKNFKNSVNRCVSALEKGGIVVYPTETSYGIGCSISSGKAIKKIYKIKNRRRDKPLPIIVADLEMAKKYAKPNKNALLLMQKFMPGPLTLIAPKTKKVPNVLSRNGIAFRVSGSCFARELSRKLGKAIVSTSANIDEPEIYSSKKAIKRFFGKADIIVDAGDLKRVKTSTIFDMKSGKVVRKGPIGIRKIKKVLSGIK